LLELRRQWDEVCEELYLDGFSVVVAPSSKNGSGFHLEIVAPESGVETPREAEAHYASSPQHKTFSDFFERIFPELGSIGPSDELVSEIVDEILEDEDGEEVPA
jgi:hypothetical protein